MSENAANRKQESKIETSMKVKVMTTLPERDCQSKAAGARDCRSERLLEQNCWSETVRAIPLERDCQSETAGARLPERDGQSQMAGVDEAHCLG